MPSNGTEKLLREDKDEWDSNEQETPAAMVPGGRRHVPNVRVH